MKLIVAALFLVVSSSVMANPDSESTIRAKGVTDGWCQAVKSLRAFQDEKQMNGGEEFITAFIFSELDKWFPGQPLEVKISSFDRMCNGSPA